MLKQIPLTPVLVWGALLIANACGDNDHMLNSNTSTSTMPEDTAREIPNKDLGRMVLSQDQLPAEYGGFEANPDNGLVTIASPDASFGGHYWGLVPGGLEQFGWESGYGNAYNDYARTEPGVLSISTEVRLFKTTDGAMANFRAGGTQFTDAANNTGPSRHANNVDLFPVDIADEAGGVDYQGIVNLIDGWSRWTAIVAFRHGRVIGNVAVDGLGLSEAEKDRLKDQVKGLAMKLDDQITAVLATGDASAPVSFALRYPIPLSGALIKTVG